ncbi:MULTISPECIES: ABC transporter ATP-binding protein [unclassified Romboutsia]|uniref:ABC transporter ATP-binding protein n=1 Tax=unclassified Romboutsia TaxID=2626894 RepID=UPI00082206A0|nr:MULTISPECIES: ABC transporter ATP-binding protein [unclassified Romboutsia]SCH30665.1 Glutamine transport ATP-binding protein GlnQ [uncultured Clostridium sp.]
MIKIKNLNKNLGGFKLSNINLELPKGYIMGLVGPNGSGKTTLIKIIMGLIEYDSGEVSIFDKRMDEYPEDIKNKVGFVYDRLNFYPELSVKDFRNISKYLYKEFNQVKFDNYLKKFNINPKVKIKNLSKGQSAKLMLANALSHNAKLLILDEPTSGLDPVVRKEVLTYIQEFIEAEDTSVLICTHNTEELDKVADYITFIDNGEIVLSKDKECLQDEYRVLRASREDLCKIEKVVNINHQKYYSEALVRVDNDEDYKEILKYVDVDNIKVPNIEDFMYYYTKKV